MLLLDKIYSASGDEVHPVLVAEADICAVVGPIISGVGMGGQLGYIRAFPEIVKTTARRTGGNAAELLLFAGQIRLRHVSLAHEMR